MLSVFVKVYCIWRYSHGGISRVGDKFDYQNICIHCFMSLLNRNIGSNVSRKYCKCSN